MVGSNKKNDNKEGGIVYPIPNSDTELVIQRAIAGIQRMISPYDGNNDNQTTTKAVIQINPAMKRHWESEIKILRDAPRDEKKLREILNAKQEECEKAEDNEDIERLVSEIEMLKFVLFLVCRYLE
jgi:PleD family two-component response regulator